MGSCPTCINRLVALLLACFAAMPLAAQTYKCADAQGRISYQQIPCPGQPVEANRIDVKPVPLLGVSPSQAAPSAALPERLEQTREPQGVANGDLIRRAPHEIPQQGRDGKDMTWCQDRQGLYYPVLPGNVCKPDSRTLALGTQPDFDRSKRTLLPVPAAPGPLGRVLIPVEPYRQATISPQHLSGNKNEACEQARANSKLQYDTNRNLSFRERGALDDQVRSLCN